MIKFTKNYYFDQTTFLRIYNLLFSMTTYATYKQVTTIQTLSDENLSVSIFDLKN